MQLDNLTVKEAACLYTHIQDDESLEELGSNLYALLQSLPLSQLIELKCRKSLPDLVIKIVNETNKIMMRLAEEVLDEKKE